MKIPLISKMFYFIVHSVFRCKKTFLVFQVSIATIIQELKKAMLKEGGRHNVIQLTDQQDRQQQHSQSQQRKHQSEKLHVDRRQQKCRQCHRCHQYDQHHQQNLREN